MDPRSENRAWRGFARASFAGLRDAWIGDDAEVAARVDRERILVRMLEYVERLPGFYRAGFVFGVWVFDWLAPLEILRLGPFRRLGQRDRERCLENWAHSRWGLKRLVFMGIKFVTVGQIYGEPALLESLGYGPAMRARRQEGR